MGEGTTNPGVVGAVCRRTQGWLALRWQGRLGTLTFAAGTGDDQDAGDRGPWFRGGPPVLPAPAVFPSGTRAADEELGRPGDPGRRHAT